MSSVAITQPVTLDNQALPTNRLSGHFLDNSLETQFCSEYGGILVHRDRIVVVLIFILETILILVDHFNFQATPELSEMRISVRAIYMLTLVIAYFYYLAPRRYGQNCQRFGFIVFSMLVHNLLIATYHHPHLTAQITPGFLIAVYIFTITAYYTFLSAHLLGTLLVSCVLGLQYMSLRWWFDVPDVDQIYAPFLLFGLIAFSHITAVSQARHRRLIWFGSHWARQRQKAAEDAQVFHTRLLELVGHDLHQPLGALRYYVAALRVGAAQLDVLEAGRSLLMADQVSRTLDQITDMLDKAIELAQLDTNTVASRCRVQSVEPLAVKLREQFATLSSLNGVELKIHGTQCLMMHDPALMMPALRNLIRNAIEHHNHQTRRPRVLLAFRAKTNKYIEIIDNGGGLPVATIATWGNPVAVANSGRPGLGLSIARQLALKQGWRMEVHNQPGRGVHFRLCYPVSVMAIN